MENMGPLLHELGGLVSQDMGKVEELNARLIFRNPRSQQPRRKAGARRTYPWWKRITSGTLKQTGHA